jgi:SAM-dependent methyltransferase
MPTNINSYLIASKYYDDAYAAMDLVDAAFYVDLAKECRGPVLEIGCGTGRVLLATAREGIEIHGLDNSAPMLAVLREKIAREEPSVRDRLRCMRATCAIFDRIVSLRSSQFRFVPCSTCLLWWNPGVRCFLS